MMSIIEHHFKQLKDLGDAGSEEGPVQQQWLKLFEALSSVALPGAGIPCFTTLDTSVANYLTNPPAKVDFTFYTNKQVGLLVTGLPLAEWHTGAGQGGAIRVPTGAG